MENKKKGPTDERTSVEHKTTSNNSNTITPPPESLNLIDLNAVEAPSNTEWLLEDAIPMHHYSILYGEGGMGKSFVANYIGILACRGGQTFCGLKFPERPVKTLLLDYELDEKEQNKRIVQLCKGLGLSEKPVNFLYAKPLVHIKDLLAGKDMKDYIRSQGIEFVIIDSLAVAGVDPMEVMSFILFTHQLRELNVTFLIVDHQAKQQATGNYNQKTAYGTVYKRNLARSEFQLSCKTVPKGNISIKMLHKKTNFGRKLDPLCFDIVFGEDEVTFEAQTVINPDEADFPFIVNAIKKLQTNNGTVIQQDILTELKDTHLSKNRILELLKNGEDVLWKIKDGKKNSNVHELIEPEF